MSQLNLHFNFLPPLENSAVNIFPVPFTDYSGRSPQLGLFLSNQLATLLQKKLPNIGIVDRSHLSDIVKEFEFMNSGLVRESNIAKLGQIESANTLLVGNIDLLDARVILNVSMLDVQSSFIIASANAVMIASNQMQLLWQKSIPGDDPNSVDQSVAQQQNWAATNPERDAFTSLIVDFIVKNWPWVWAVLLVPPFTWFVKRLHRWRSNREEKRI